MDTQHFTHITHFIRYPTRVLLTSAPVSREKVKIVCQEYREYLGFIYTIFPKPFWFVMNYQTKEDNKLEYFRRDNLYIKKISKLYVSNYSKGNNV